MSNIWIKEFKIDLPISTLTLVIGDWKAFFTEQQSEILISEALNYTLSEHEFKHALVGYLITKRRVCLILKIEHHLVIKFLNCFYDAVERKILQHFEHLKKTKLKNVLQYESIKLDDLYEDLFEEFPTINYQLIKLITGREVVLPYYSPHLQRLKDKVRNYNYCSAIDYSGAKSAVKVTVLTQGQWEWEEHKHRWK